MAARRLLGAFAAVAARLRRGGTSRPARRAGRARPRTGGRLALCSSLVRGQDGEDARPRYASPPRWTGGKTEATTYIWLGRGALSDASPPETPHAGGGAGASTAWATSPSRWRWRWMYARRPAFCLSCSSSRMRNLLRSSTSTCSFLRKASFSSWRCSSFCRFRSLLIRACSLFLSLRTSLLLASAPGPESSTGAGGGARRVGFGNASRGDDRAATAAAVAVSWS